MKKIRFFPLLAISVLIISCSGDPSQSSEFTVTFNGDGGTLISGEEKQKVDDANKINPPVYEKKGYNFSGWDKDIKSIKTDTTVTAKWTTEPYTYMSFHSKVQQNYLAGPYGNIDTYVKGSTTEKSFPEALTIKWDATSGKEQYKFEYSKDNTFPVSDTKVFTVNVPQIDLYNLELNQTYYYRVDGGEIKKMSTEDNIVRNLKVGNIPNFRDMGGYKGSNGVVKQSLLYRSYSFANNGYATIDDEGKKVLKDDLKIKTEIDLWGYGDAKLEGVNYVPLQMKDSASGGYNLLTLPENTAPLKSLFNDYFSKESNYPMVFHCKKGKDRTGVVGFLVLNLLGVDSNDVFKDFLFSSFAFDCYVSKEVFSSYYSTISSYSGKNAQERTVSFMKEYLGVSQDAISSFINILS